MRGAARLHSHPENSAAATASPGQMPAAHRRLMTNPKTFSPTTDRNQPAVQRYAPHGDPVPFVVQLRGLRPRRVCSRGIHRRLYDGPRCRLAVLVRGSIAPSGGISNARLHRISAVFQFSRFTQVALTRFAAPEQGSACGGRRTAPSGRCVTLADSMTTLRFAHWLVRQVGYEALLLTGRRERHRGGAETMETRQGGAEFGPMDRGAP